MSFGRQWRNDSGTYFMDRDRLKFVDDHEAPVIYQPQAPQNFHGVARAGSNTFGFNKIFGKNQLTSTNDGLVAWSSN